jgi:hypothetical protein
MSIGYAFVGSDSLLTDGTTTNVLFLRDVSEDSINWRSEALAASGDYFETLAAKLEEIATALPEVSVEQYQMQDVISQLLYMQRRYKLVRKNT